MWLDVFKWPEMIKYKKERDDQFAGTEGRFDMKLASFWCGDSITVIPNGHGEALCHTLCHIVYISLRLCHIDYVAYSHCGQSDLKLELKPI